MSSQDMGIGNQRRFTKFPISRDQIRFIAPTPAAEAMVAEARGLSVAGRDVLRQAEGRAADDFKPLPAPTGTAPFRLPLSDILAADDMNRIAAGGKLVFHAAGDVGDIHGAGWQDRVVLSMQADFNRPQPADKPSFHYLLGDAVYFIGAGSQFNRQFYQPYEDYPAPIFAIPGNHDGDSSVPAQSLEAFVRNFCATTPHHSPDSTSDIYRDTMTQPNVYFTLQTPLATIVGLYSNVPEGGEIRSDQADWFVGELQDAPTDRALIVAVHHPLFSGDDMHSGSRQMVELFETAMRDAGRIPDLILTAHVHNYQRYTWPLQSRQVPVIVAGAGGYKRLHRMARINGHRIHTPFHPHDITAVLETYVDNRHGFLRLEVTAGRIVGKYYTLPDRGSGNRGQRADIFRLDLASHQLVAN